ncbi:MAG: sialate O-acetylesterase [Prevotella sp.]|nr:sialate O-acetylesterase [Prevotella sp.]
MTRKRLFLTTWAVLLLCIAVSANVRLPLLFQDGMVLQRGADINVWGWADAGEQVVVSLLNSKQKVLSTATTTADAQGRWLLCLPKNKKMKPGGGYVLTIKSQLSNLRSSSAGLLPEGRKNSQINNVSLGDVWLLSGQSNIDVTIERVYPWYTGAIDSMDNAQVRLFRVQNDTSTGGEKDDIRQTSINWLPLNKQNAWLFSAVGAFLGQQMQEHTGVPQGIIVNSWGGTPIEAWISADTLRNYYPMLVEKTRLYDNPDYIRAQQQANSQADRRWNQMLDERDPGMQQGFTALDYDDSSWTTIQQYQWSWRGIGSTWLRQHVQVDAAHAGQPARLLLGTLFDADITYVNGQQVGRTYYQYPPRRYDIPEGLLREGDNVITVRFINKYGAAHFIPEKPYLIAFGPDRYSLNPLPQDVIRLSEQWKQHAGADMPQCPSGDVSLQNLPSTLYNAVLRPLAPMTLAGVVWYQGESNTGGDASSYANKLALLMSNWRQAFQQPQMPFAIVQLANYMECVQQPQNTGWSQVREAQRTVAANDPYAECVVNIDLGETQDIHPLRKREVAQRIALCFRRLVLGERVALFPQVVSATVLPPTSSAGPEPVAAEPSCRVVLTLDQPLRPGSLKYFELAGSDGSFVNAEATATGNTITVTVPAALNGSTPTKMRYAWKNNPLNADVYGLDSHLPLSPFEIDLGQHLSLK